MTDQEFDFSWALLRMRKGGMMARKGWNGKGMWCALQVPDEHSKMNRPYLYLKSVQNDYGPWLPSQTDLLAKDWIEVARQGKAVDMGAAIEAGEKLDVVKKS
jgi:hypothetical protein